MRVCCVADLHGHFPVIPDCDLLVLAGDYCRDHEDWFWYRDVFAPWVNLQAERAKVVGVAGNHDFVFERTPHLVPRMDWSYLQDSGVEWGGLKIWGSPWQPRFFDWAFNLDEPELEKKWALVPRGTDVLVLHGPPHGYGDFSQYGNVHAGSPGLLRRIQEVRPRLAVAGHIHPGYGRYRIGETVFVNAAHVNEKYEPANPPVVVDI